MMVGVDDAFTFEIPIKEGDFSPFSGQFLLERFVSLQEISTQEVPTQNEV